MSDEEPKRSANLAGTAFGASFKEHGLPAPPLSVDTAIDQLIGQFQSAAHIDEAGVEFWYARDLQKLLGYSDYRNFLNIVDKAKSACVNSGQGIENHFVDVTEMVTIGSGARRAIDDTKLTRYACYLIAQNGDARKKPIAFAQTYFAIQTRRQELEDQAESEYETLSDEEKRVLLREEIKLHNKHLASAAKGAGVTAPLDYAIFQTFGYKGLYGGLDKKGIQRSKGLKREQDILDHMGSTELAANLFRATQTEEKLRRENIRGKDAANQTHFEVGRKVRQTIRDLGGTLPENLPPEEDIKKVQKRLKASAKPKALR